MDDKEVIIFADGKRRNTIKMKDGRILVGQLEPVDKIKYQFMPEIKAEPGAFVGTGGGLLEEFMAEDIDAIS